MVKNIIMSEQDQDDNDNVCVNCGTDLEVDEELEKEIEENQD